MRGRLALAACGVSTAIACSALLGIEPGNPEDRDASPPDASSADSSLADPCDHVRPAAPPEVDDAPGVELPPFIVALEGVVMTVGPGLDLDGVCTCDTRPGTAHGGSSSCTRSSPPCDMDGGVDNSLAMIATELSAFFDVAAGPNDLVKAGQRTVLLQIAKYNGRGNDKEIVLGVVASKGIREQGCATSTQKGQFWTPGWCGDDVWTLEAASIVATDPGAFVPVVLGSGYVRDHRFVVRLSGVATLPISEDFKLPLGSPLIVGRLIALGEDLKPRDELRPPTARENRLYRIEDGVLGGRIAAPDMLAAIGTVRQDKTDAGDTRLCTSPGFAALKARVCDGLDIARSESLDFDASAVCDAISTGIGFTAMPALPGTIDTDTPSPTSCHPGPNGDPQGVAGVTYRCP